MTRRASKTSPREIEAANVEARCVELRNQKLTLDEIAPMVGLKNRSSVATAIGRALRRRVAPHVDELRAAMDADYLVALDIAWSGMVQGEWPAFDRWLKTMQQRAALWGANVNEAKIADAATTMAAASALQVGQVFTVIQQALADPRLGLTEDQLSLVPVVLGEHLERADIATGDTPDDDPLDGVAWETGDPPPEGDTTDE